MPETPGTAKHRIGKPPADKVRRLIVCALGLLLATAGCEGPRPPMFRVGMLCGLDALAPALDGFRAKMTALGYIEGRDIAYDARISRYDPALERRVLEKFIADRVDLIVAVTSQVALAAKEAARGTGIPVVFCQATVEDTHLINSIREPGDNITGVRYPTLDLARKRFEILHELVPAAKRFWTPYARGVRIVPGQLEALRQKAAAAGVTLVESPVDQASDLLAELERREQNEDIGFDAVLFISEPLALSPGVFPAIGRAAKARRIPMGGAAATMDGYSTLFGVAADNVQAGELAAQQAHKILRGAPAGAIPVASPDIFFQINHAEAQRLGLRVPLGLLKEANEIIRSTPDGLEAP
ncbi:MAG: ABC transporter substrate-binding protein [Pseudomonadota bacterium]